MRYAQLALSGSYLETAPQQRSLFSPRRGPIFRFDRFLSLVEHLLKNKKIDTVLVDQRLDFRPAAPGALEAIRRQLERLSAAGKRLVYYARGYDTATLFLASACSERILHPLGTLRFQGMAHSFVFFKKLLERYELDVEVVRRGRYKSAGDRFRVDRLDEHNREQHQAFLDAAMRRFVDAVRTGCSKSSSEIDALLAGKVLSAEQAVETKWVSRSISKSTLLEEWRKEKSRVAGLKKVKIGFGRGKKVAVLVFEGAIVDGRTRQDPLLGTAIGSDSFIPEIERLAKTKAVKGVVLRIDSGGGSATASEEIAEALARLAEKKPLVVSMAGVAGSGGYWIALPAERIFAERTTLTGSVGVISMLISARKSLQRFGVTAASVKVGELADLGSPFKDFSELDRTVIEEEVDRLYRAFLAKAADSRKSTSDDIHRVAEGRIWAAEDAKTAGLVDEIGGIDAALEYLRAKLGKKRLKVRFFPVVKYSIVQRIIMRNAASVDGGLQAALGGLAGVTARVASSAVPLATFLVESRGRPLALMEDAGEVADYR